MTIFSIIATSILVGLLPLGVAGPASASEPTIPRAAGGQALSVTAPQQVHAGDELVYSVLLQNWGDVTLSGVRVRDDQGAADCPTITLQPQESAHCEIRVNATQHEIDSGEIQQRTEVTATTPTGEQIRFSDQTITVHTPPLPQARAQADVDRPRARVGDVVQTMVRIENIGNVTLTVISVLNDAGETLECDTTSIVPGESARCARSTTLGDDRIGVWRQEFSITSVAPDGAAVHAGRVQADAVVAQMPDASRNGAAAILWLFGAAVVLILAGLAFARRRAAYDDAQEYLQTEI